MFCLKGVEIMSDKVLVVDDEHEIADLIEVYLQNENYEVLKFYSAKEALACIEATELDLAILDIMLPDIDGYQLLREIKADSPGRPVIYISARDADLDRVIGLEMGSDDYLPKPFLPRELVIRTRKLLERIYAPEQDMPNITISPYVIDQRRRVVTLNDEELDLTSKEFDILLLFSLHSGQAFSRAQIIARVWGNDYIGSDRVVDDLIRRLRKKMTGLKLETIYGYGYRMIKT
jgi:two-component system response regulator CssR